MPRFFAEIIEFPSACIEDPSSVRHITGPLRRRRGDELAVRVGDQGYRAVITSIRAGKIMLEILSGQNLRDRGGGAVHLGLCLFDLRELEDSLRSVIELGVTDIHPVISTRSSVRAVTAARFSRWHAIVLEAVKQCERKTVPVIHEPVDVQTLVRQESRGWDRRLFAHQDARQVISPVPGHDVGIVIGPEGGFTDEEILMMKAEGFTAVSMGNTTLRAVTAAITAVGILGLK
ncbi:MAG TPA: RsmE family RNA methyltransferase [Deltaproteobacteria bacterium]|nr:RsmE family RNA methyltransferase [Deltaproteobacteria bacterium]HPR56462.1 RsmE family RNA methyltransferase [Deltaproteobacteria bacterium]HXK48413.1 RsmE family RNA methyltransferase [Deltaproteobacteria bacterium]